MREPGSAMDFRIAAGAAVASTGGGDVFADLGSRVDNGIESRRFVLADCGPWHASALRQLCSMA
ncbi:MAG: hypothetical protein R3D29_07765 [Nitratireductor sp.]